LSIYGWKEGGDTGFTSRHPEFKRGKGTVQLRPEDAPGIPGEELRELLAGALDA